MGLGLEVVGGHSTAPGAGPTAATANSGNSFTIRNARLDSKVYLISIWAKNQVAGFLQIRSPKLHDNVRGIRSRVTAAVARQLDVYGVLQRLVPQDNLIVENAGSAVGGQFEIMGMLVFYEDLPGSAARLLDWDTVKKNIVNLVSAESALVPTAAGGWTGQQAINAGSDLFKANTDYAILGYVCTALTGSIRWLGPDFGNLGVGGPGEQDSQRVTQNWFCDLSRLTGLPTVPVWNAANKFGTFIDTDQDQAATAVTVTTYMAELPPGLVRVA